MNQVSWVFQTIITFIILRVRQQQATMTRSSSYTIRPATLADQSAIAALVIQNHLALSQDHPEEYIRQAMDLATDFDHLIQPRKFQSSLFYVAQNEADTIVASAGLIPLNVKNNEEADVVVLPNDTNMELTGVSVHPQHRRTGLAKSLVQSVLKDAHTRGCQHVRLVTLKERMSAACQLYESLGFQILDEDEVVHAEKPVMTIRRYILDLQEWEASEH
jgi:ribosomal protein S18 acetylase RimI-like enzyme